MAVTLLPSINLDDATSQWFKFGSIEQQNSGQVLYTGLKVLGTLVADSPIYIAQSGSKLTKYWQDADASNFQILVKAKAAGALIDSGNVTVFSRKYGQTYSRFDVNLSAGGEQAAALGTSLDANVSLTAGQAETIFGTITITVADTTQTGRAGSQTAQGHHRPQRHDHAGAGIPGAAMGHIRGLYRHDQRCAWLALPLTGGRVHRERVRTLRLLCRWQVVRRRKVGGCPA